MLMNMAKRWNETKFIGPEPVKWENGPPVKEFLLNDIEDTLPSLKIIKENYENL